MQRYVRERKLDNTLPSLPGVFIIYVSQTWSQHMCHLSQTPAELSTQISLDQCQIIVRLGTND